jgi:hypothetical protein
VPGLRRDASITADLHLSEVRARPATREPAMPRSPHDTGVSMNANPWRPHCHAPGIWSVVRDTTNGRGYFEYLNPGGPHLKWHEARAKAREANRATEPQEQKHAAE